ncbi:MAG: 3D domain-containing protein, partial [Alphaproteobacteria bacterium]|nr:3D domain-containing protein [Alphaproteobacteria bacterium]
PIGAEGVPLTPGRSLAVDRAFVPFGVPVWLDAADPARPNKDRVRRLLIAQDTGGAIKGPVRGDVFWGFGPKAAARAGRMKHIGVYYLLLPRAKAARPVAAR